jgi:predicted TIM-barrel fold metal-dependent hydrolase
MLQAYNDWHIDGWCGAQPGRFIPLAIPILWDPKLMADEIRRVARKGCHAISFADNPGGLGYPSLHNEYWEPVWKAAADEGCVLAIHIGSGTGMKLQDTAAPIEIMIHATPVSLFGCASELVWSKFLRNYSGLKIALSEGGTGWIPYFLDRLDRTYDMHHRWTGQDFGDKLPSEVFREHFLTCFIADPVGVQLRELIGIDNIAWECDYPHSDSSWPQAPEELDRVMAGVPDEHVRKITFENACRWYSFDPFTTRSRETCTVGALRAEAAGHDVSVRSYDKGRFERTHTGADLGKLASKATA